MSQTKARGVQSTVKDEPVEEFIIENDQSINDSPGNFSEIEYFANENSRDRTR